MAWARGSDSVDIIASDVNYSRERRTTVTSSDICEQFSETNSVQMVMLFSARELQVRQISEELRDVQRTFVGIWY
jgi:hypothetical protein